MTNAEKIRNMSEEDLASFLGRISACCQGVGYFQKPAKDCCSAMYCPIADFISNEKSICSDYDILQYLRSEVSECNTNTMG